MKSGSNHYVLKEQAVQIDVVTIHSFHQFWRNIYLELVRGLYVVVVANQ